MSSDLIHILLYVLFAVLALYNGSLAGKALGRRDYENAATSATTTLILIGISLINFWLAVA